ncbi:hypothetical protein [Billgrantia desiderata]|uniref:hypothetical protein n=1 Tax=Billgrantia desiderata TaxID=52021 RepID=UPI0011B0C216|nr:hypothetical protein [Halomonas desiderata]
MRNKAGIYLNDQGNISANPALPEEQHPSIKYSIVQQEELKRACRPGEKIHGGLAELQMIAKTEHEEWYGRSMTEAIRVS